MTAYSLKHLANDVLLRELASVVSQDRSNTALMLAHLAEVDERRLYLPASYPSMFLYCVHELHMSEDMAYKRIQAARAARRFPVILHALAEGQLHLTAVVLLAPFLKPDTAPALIAAATHRTKAQVELLLAERFPKPDMPTLIRAIAAPQAAGLTAFSEFAPSTVPMASTGTNQLVPEPVGPSTGLNTTEHVIPLGTPPAPRPRIAPLSPGRFALQVTLAQSTYEKLRHAQSLLGHALPSAPVDQVIDRALDSLIAQLETRKFAKCARPRPQSAGTNTRYIPAAVRRAVFERDGGQCTYVGDGGKRCGERTRLEYDHVVPVARGGRSTVAGVRLRCRAHNQYTAECVYGSSFMSGRREASQRRAMPARQEAGATNSP
jgi:hypothetical protein